METTRKAVFAGRFYPKNKIEIKKLLDKILKSEIDKIDRSFDASKPIGAVVPHAGYIYSGYQAIHVYDFLKKYKNTFDTFVIINPNHTGLGNGAFNISGTSKWDTPLGSVPTNIEFAEALNIEINENAHKKEHSGEVQLPMLQHFLPYPFKIVMITMNIQNQKNALKLANLIDEAVKKTKQNIFLLASSDFSHFETPEEGFKKDQYMIDEILKLDAPEIHQQIIKHHVSACGYGPIMTLIEYLKVCTVSPKIKMLRRGHSGEITPSNKVVNYASFLCYE